MVVIAIWRGMKAHEKMADSMERMADADARQIARHSNNHFYASSTFRNKLAFTPRFHIAILPNLCGSSRSGLMGAAPLINL